MAYRPVNRIVEIADLTQSPVTGAALFEHLRVDGAEEAVLIETLAAAATAHIERFTNRLLQVRDVVLRLPSLPTGQCPVELPGGKVVSVTSVLIDGVAFTGATAVGEAPALLLPNADWPAVTGEGYYPVVITYKAGYVDAPQPLLVALRMIVADLFEHRMSGMAGAVSEVPFAARTLMLPYRIRPA
jgi:uncharacterized phiE125 gp8 family phage protein